MSRPTARPPRPPARARLVAATAVAVALLAVPPAGAQAPGDGGFASTASLTQVGGLAVAPDGSVLIADRGDLRVRRVAPDGTISTLAGTGTPGFSGDGGPAATAQLGDPGDVAVRPDGSVVIADTTNRRVRLVDVSGTITTLAGTGAGILESGNGGPATAADFISPDRVAALSDGSTLVSSSGGGQVRRIDPAGTISAFAGTGNLGYSGDGGLATAAELRNPSGLTQTPDGGVLISSTGNHVVRRVDPGGTITTVAGSGVGPGTSPGGFGGDGGPALGASFDGPGHLAARPGGGFVVFDSGNARVRVVDAASTVSTLAGGGTTAGLPADGGPATAAALQPGGAAAGVATLADGSTLIADGPRVRRVSPAGVITTFAGGGPPSPPDPQPTLVPQPPPPDPQQPPTPPTVPIPFPPPTLGDPTPVAGRSATSGRVTGTVTVRRPRGSRFVPLLPGVAVPNGSELDTTRGTVTLNLRGVGGQSSSARISLGRTVFSQGPRRSRYLTDLRLTGPACRAPAPVNDRRAPVSTGRYPKPKARASRAGTRAAKPTRKPRRLRVKRIGSGEVRTRTNDGAAVARGTDWRTTETCTGTTYAVTEGRIAVHDLVRGGTRNVGRGGRLSVRRR